jgi:hypothetical protein
VAKNDPIAFEKGRDHELDPGIQFNENPYIGLINIDTLLV